MLSEVKATLAPRTFQGFVRRRCENCASDNIPLRLSSVKEGGSRVQGFITANPQTVHRGSGCYVGTSTLPGCHRLGNTVR